MKTFSTNWIIEDTHENTLMICVINKSNDTGAYLGRHIR